MAPNADIQRQRRSQFGRLRHRAPPTPTEGIAATLDELQDRFPSTVAGISRGEITAVMASQNTGRLTLQNYLPSWGRKKAPKEDDVAKTPKRFADKYKGWTLYRHIRDQSWSVGNVHCCGIKEIHGVQHRFIFQDADYCNTRYEYATPEEMIPCMQKAMKDIQPPRPLWFFSDADKKTSVGETLAKYIEAHGLGTVQRSGYHRNPNSGNEMQMYVWTINNDKFFAHKPKV